MVRDCTIFVGNLQIARVFIVGPVNPAPYNCFFQRTVFEIMIVAQSKNAITELTDSQLTNRLIDLFQLEGAVRIPQVIY